MKHFLFSIVFLSPAFIMAQSAIIRDATATIRFGDSSDVRIIFPIVKSEKKEVDDKINYLLRDTLLLPNISAKEDEISLKKLIEGCAATGLSMDYEINFNLNGLLCLQFYYDVPHIVLDAIPERNFRERQVCLNFDLSDGHLISLDEILQAERKKSFYEMIYKMKCAEIDDSIVEWKRIPQSKYRRAIEFTESFRNNTRQQTFYLSSVEMVVIDQCIFPSPWEGLGLGPEMEFIISKSEMEYYLKPEVYHKLVQ